MKARHQEASSSSQADTEHSSAVGRSTITQRHAARPSAAEHSLLDSAWATSPVQLEADSHTGLDDEQVRAAAGSGIAGIGQPLPYLDRIQRAFGSHDVTGVRAHFGEQAKQANATLGSHAYATGNDIAFANSSPSLHLVAHEAAHVVQQRAGVSLSSAVGRAGDCYEQHADAVADLVARGESAMDLLSVGPVGEPPRVRRDAAKPTKSAVPTISLNVPRSAITPVGTPLVIEPRIAREEVVPENHTVVWSYAGASGFSVRLERDVGWDPQLIVQANSETTFQELHITAAVVSPSSVRVATGTSKLFVTASNSLVPTPPSSRPSTETLALAAAGAICDSIELGESGAVVAGRWQWLVARWRTIGKRVRMITADSHAPAGAGLRETLEQADLETIPLWSELPNDAAESVRARYDRALAMVRSRCTQEEVHSEIDHAAEAERKSGEGEHAIGSVAQLQSGLARASAVVGAWANIADKGAASAAELDKAVRMAAPGVGSKLTTFADVVSLAQVMLSGADALIQEAAGDQNDKSDFLKWSRRSKEIADVLGSLAATISLGTYAVAYVSKGSAFASKALTLLRGVKGADKLSRFNTFVSGAYALVILCHPDSSTDDRIDSIAPIAVAGITIAEMAGYLAAWPAALLSTAILISAEVYKADRDARKAELASVLRSSMTTALDAARTGARDIYDASLRLTIALKKRAEELDAERQAAFDVEIDEHRKALAAAIASFPPASLKRFATTASTFVALSATSRHAAKLTAKGSEESLLASIPFLLEGAEELLSNAQALFVREHEIQWDADGGKSFGIPAYL